MLKRCIALIVLFGCAAAIVAQDQAKSKVAVLDATVPEGVDASAVGPVTESVIEKLVASGSYIVIDRANIDKVLKEQEFQISGIVDESGAVSAGKLLGADAVVVIKVQKMDSIFYITVKMIDVKTAQIVRQSSDSRETDKLAALLEMAQAASARLLGESVPTVAAAVAASASQPASASGVVAGAGSPGGIPAGRPGSAPFAASPAPGAPAPGLGSGGAIPVGLRIAFVASPSPDPDNPFFRLARNGLKAFADINGLTPEQLAVIRPEKPEELRPALARAAEGGYDLVMCVGGMAVEPLRDVARKFPSARFAILDAVVEVPNVVSVMFADRELGAIAGIVAGVRARTDGKTMVGFVGGRDMPPTRMFLAGFTAGVKAAFPACEVIADYAGAFDKPELGRAVAKRLFDRGAWIVYSAAGFSGVGVFMEAVERARKGDRRWVIGSDVDQYPAGQYAPGQSVTLTSAIKRFDVAAHFVARALAERRLPLGTVAVLGVAEGGVGLPPVNPNFTPDIASAIADLGRKLRDGILPLRDKP